MPVKEFGPPGDVLLLVIVFIGLIKKDRIATGGPLVYFWGLFPKYWLFPPNPGPAIIYSRWQQYCVFSSLCGNRLHRFRLFWRRW